MSDPHNEAAEEHVLGAMLISESAIEAVLAEFEPDGEAKFYRPTHDSIYRAIRALYRSKRGVDAITVTNLLDGKGLLNDTQRTHVHDLSVSVTATGNAAHHARIVREMWAKREVAVATRTGFDQAMNGVPADEALAATMTALVATEALINRGRSGPTTFATLAERLEERVANPPPDIGIPAPFPSFPKLRPKRLYLLSGYTKDGKTAVACQFAAKAAIAGYRVGFFTIEMSEDQLFDRMVASCGVPLHQVESGRLGDVYRDTFEQAVKMLAPMRVELIDDPGSSAATIGPVQRARKYDLLIVDHLHRITLPGPANERRHRLEDEMRALTNLTLTEGVPMLLLAQLSRSGSPAQPYPRPSPTMLRDTSVIEQEAALSAFVYRDRDPVTHEPKEEAHMIIAHNRFGPSGNFLLRFIGDQMRYVEVAP